MSHEKEKTTIHSLCFSFHQRNELNSIFLGFAETNHDKFPSLSLGQLNSSWETCFPIKRLLASTMFNHLKNFLNFYHRQKNQTDSTELRKVSRTKTKLSNPVRTFVRLVTARCVELHFVESRCRGHQSIRSNLSIIWFIRKGKRRSSFSFVTWPDFSTKIWILNG